MAKKVRLDENGFRKFGFIDKLAYAAGDFGCNMSFALKNYMLVYWTQYMGIEQNLYAILMVIVQVWDAINDPLIGGIIDADRRKYKLGKFRTYIFVGSIGLVLAGALCFLPLPNLSQAIKILLYICGYVLWDAFYTIANVPYGSMLSLITGDTGEQAQLSSWRSLGSIVANLGVGMILPMFLYDSANNLRGNVMIIFALVMGVLGFACFQLMVHKTVERVDVSITLSEEAPKFNIFKAALNFFKNRPAMGATLGAVSMFIGMTGAQAANTAMWQAYFGAAQFSGLISMITMIPMFVFMPFVRPIVKKFGMKEAVAAGSIVSILGCALMFVMPITPDMKGIALYVVCMFINGLGGGIYQCVSYSMMGAAIDYNEWKFGKRDEGTTYAIHSFFRKLIQGIAPSVGLVVAGALGYVATLGAAQTPEVAHNMFYVVAGAYTLGAILQFIGVGFIYNLDKKTSEKMYKELAERRAAYTNSQK